MKREPQIDGDYELMCRTGDKPERSLLRAIVLRGVADAVAEIADDSVATSCIFRAPRHWKRDASYWLNSTSRKPFSFVWCLQHLFPDDWDPLAKAIRRRVERGDGGCDVVKAMFRAGR